DLSAQQVADSLGGAPDTSCVAFAHQGKFMATCNESGQIQLWDPATRNPLAYLRCHWEKIYGLAFSPDDELLASAAFYGTVCLSNLRTRNLHQVFSGHADRSWSVAFSPDGTWLAS